MKRAALYLGLSLGGLSLALGALPAMAQNATPDGTPTRSCVYALKDGATGMIPAPASATTAQDCEKLGEAKFGKGIEQCNVRQCGGSCGEAGDADNTTDYTNACKTSWTRGE